MELQEPAASAPCWGCGRNIGPQDAYCRYCGKGQGDNVPWYYGHVGIIAMTVLGLGPFSLGYVWKSPRLSRAAKWVYTVLILGFTWFMIAALFRLWAAINAALTGGLAGYGL